MGELSLASGSSIYARRLFGCVLIALLVGVGIIFFARCDQVLASSGRIIGHLGNEDITLDELESEFRLENVGVEHQQDPEVTQLYQLSI